MQKDVDDIPERGSKSELFSQLNVGVKINEETNLILSLWLESLGRQYRLVSWRINEVVCSVHSSALDKDSRLDKHQVPRPPLPPPTELVKGT